MYMYTNRIMQLPLLSGWTASVWIATVILSLFSKTQVLASDRNSVYYVATSNSGEGPCKQQGVTCQTLDEYITDGTLNDSYTKLVFLNGTHHLTRSLMVYDSENLTLQGRNNSVQVVCKSRWTIALSFTRVSFLMIQNIGFVNCSYDNTFIGQQKMEYIVSALHFEGGSNLTLSDVRILNGGFSIISTHGQVEITRMNITSHLYYQIGRHSLQSFGGSFFHYFSCNQQLYLTITQSFFQFDKTVLVHRSTKYRDKYSSHGLGITFCCSNIQVVMKKSSFYGFQSPGEGGNLMISLDKSWYDMPIHSYLIKIHECHFENGYARHGGGTFISVVQPYLSNTSHFNPTKLAILNISDTMFTKNSASESAGLSFTLKEFSRHPIIGCITIERSNFTRNYLKAKNSYGGIAIHISTFHVMPSSYHSTPTFKIALKNCSIQDNYFRGDKKCSSGNGVITIVATTHFQIINSNFKHNNCTAIKAVGSNLLLEGEVDIMNNYGSSGGGLLLCDNSVIILKPNTHISIKDNTANHTGGGITAETPSLQTRPMCFYQLSEEITRNISLLNTVQVVLTNNTAGYAGDNLFGGSVDYCYLMNIPQNGRHIKEVIMLMFKKIFKNLSTANSSVTSIARKICFCDNGEKNCSRKKFSAEIYPGETFPVDVVPVGQLDGTVPASIRARATNGKYTLHHNELIQNIGEGKCKGLRYTVKSNRNHENISLHIQHEGDISGYIKSSLYRRAKIQVMLKHCPIGFNLAKNCQNNSHGCKCQCDDSSLRLPAGDVKCFIENKTIIKSLSIWIGYIKDPYNQTSQKYLTHHRCVFDYCGNNDKIVSKPDQLLQDSQCQFNRTGILCGACDQKLSVILGSSKCWSCSNTSLLLILTFALAGILLILLLTVCDLTVSKGKMSGLIFYANIVHISDAIFIPDRNKTLSSLLKTITAWINLDLGINACFYNGMDAYAKAWLQFVFPLYLWILSGLVVFLCNRYISVTRLFGTNSVRVLATVILLSFTKLLRAVITTLSCITLNLHKNGTIETTTLWTSDPNILCLQGKHIPLFVFGLLFSVVWTVFIVFLLFIQCWPRLRCCSRIQRLKPFTDSFTGPNTSHGRFWTGILLLSRLVIAIAYSICGNNNNYHYYFACIVITSVSLLQISACLPSGVYNTRSSNILETFFMINVLVIAFGAGIGSHNCKYVSVSLVLITFGGIVLYHFWIRVKRTRCGILVLEHMERINAIVRKKEDGENTEIVIDGCVNRKFQQLDEYREPLLAF